MDSSTKHVLAFLACIPIGIGIALVAAPDDEEVSEPGAAADDASCERDVPLPSGVDPASAESSCVDCHTPDELR